MLATNNQNSDSIDEAPVAPILAAPLPAGLRDLSVAPATLMAAPVQKKPVALATDFTNVRGQMPTKATPSLAQPLITPKPVDEEDRAKKRLFKDITVIRLNSSDEEASGLTAARNQLRNEAENNHSYGYDASASNYSSESSYSGGGVLNETVWQDQMYQSSQKLDHLQNEATQLRAERDVIQDRIDARKPVLEEGAAHEGEWKDTHDKLVERVDNNEKDKIKAAEGETKAKNDYSAAYVKANGASGPMSFNSDAREEAEDKLRQDVMDKNKDALKAQYLAKGVQEKDFDALYRSENHKSLPDDDVGGAGDRARALGLPVPLSVGLTDYLKDHDPTNPYLNTVATKLDGVYKALAFSTKVSEESIKLQNEHAQDKINELQAKLDNLQKARTDDAADAAKKLSNAADLSKVEKDIQEMKTYQEWISKNKGKVISKEEFQNNVPDSMRASFIQDMAAQNVQAPAAPKADDRSIASAAMNTIDAPPVKDSFNTAAPGAQPPAPDSAPAPQAPAPQEQKPAASAPAAPAM